MQKLTGERLISQNIIPLRQVQKRRGSQAGNVQAGTYLQWKDWLSMEKYRNGWYHSNLAATI